MPTFTLQFDPAKGPICRVGLVQARSVGGTGDDLAVYDALIDSGASMTFVSESAANSLSLRAITKTPVMSVHDVQEKNLYLADFYIECGGTNFDFHDIPMIEFRGTDDYDVIIGRDFLKYVVFIMNRDTFTLCL